MEWCLKNESCAECIKPDLICLDSIELGLKWENLPLIANCPVLVWDPTFHTLLPTGEDINKGGHEVNGSATGASPSGNVCYFFVYLPYPGGGDGMIQNGHG